MRLGSSPRLYSVTSSLSWLPQPVRRPSSLSPRLREEMGLETSNTRGWTTTRIEPQDPTFLLKNPNASEMTNWVGPNSTLHRDWVSICTRTTRFPRCCGTVILRKGSGPPANSTNSPRFLRESTSTKNEVSAVLVVETICWRLRRRLGGEYTTKNAQAIKRNKSTRPISKNSCHWNRTPIEVVKLATMAKMIPWLVTPQIPRVGLQLPELFFE